MRNEALMSLEEKALRDDIESYLRGEEPSADALAKASRLDIWAPVISRDAGGGYIMTLVGKVSAHPTIADGKQTETREIVWLDRKRRWARTRDRLWMLGEPEGTEIAAHGADL
jgi:hypothetical protein